VTGCHSQRHGCRKEGSQAGAPFFYVLKSQIVNVKYNKFTTFLPLLHSLQKASTDVEQILLLLHSYQISRCSLTTLMKIEKA
jgi:hypothetical protein